MIAFGSDCARHRAALLDFVDRRECGPDTEAALDHLSRCRACEWDLEATAMAVTALRRLHDDVRSIEPAPEAWERLRTRVTRSRDAVWRWRASLAGLALSACLVTSMVAPVALRGMRQTDVTYLHGLEGLGSSPAADSGMAVDYPIRPARTEPIGDEISHPSAAARWAGPDGLGIAIMTEAAAQEIDRHE